jgi:iron(III) transport system permease protein
MAGVLIFVLSLGTFAVPEVMGTPAGFSTVTTQIYADLALSSDQASFVDAITLAMLLVVLTLVIVVPADLVLGVRLQISRTAATDVGWPPRARAPRFVVAIAMTLYLTLTTGLPLLALLSAALTRAVGVRSTPANWTLDNFVAVLTPRTGDAIGRSLVLALVAASILLLLGGCTAALGRTRSGRGVGVLVALTLVLPGSTLAIGMLISYGRWLADTTAIILVAYVAKLWAIAHRPIAAALDRVPGGELRAARVSGANLPIALATVVVPRLRTALVTAWGLCFLTALHEVTMSSLLYGPGNETLAVVVLNSADLGRIGVTAALSVVVTALVLIPATAVWVLGRRTARG